MPRVLMVASAGGHWIQLRRLTPAFDECEVYFASTDERLGVGAGLGDRFFAVRDGNFASKLSLVPSLLSVLVLVLRLRPDVVVSTGAAPGFFAIVLGKVFGARTVWIDSVANAGELSLAGQKVRGWSDVWLTQWEHLAHQDGPDFWGSVL